MVPYLLKRVKATPVSECDAMLIRSTLGPTVGVVTNGAFMDETVLIHELLRALTVFDGGVITINEGVV